MRSRAIFLDKDGTLIEDVPYNVKPQEIRLMPGAADGVQLLHRLGYRLVVISNQAGVARGYFAERELVKVAVRLQELLAEFGVPLGGFYYCPHDPAGSVHEYAVACACRKPSPGLIWRAAYELNIDIAGSWFIGDILDDIEAGHRSGCLTAFVDNGNETEWRISNERLPDIVAADLAQAAQFIGKWSNDTGALVYGYRSHSTH